MSLGFARLGGNSAGSVTGSNILGTAPTGKSYGLLALGPTLYAWISPGSNVRNYDQARLYSAPLGTNQWTAAKWAFKKDDAAHLILPTFLQAGQDYAAISNYVYVYAARYDPKVPGQLSVQGASGKGEIALLRALKTSNLLAKDSWYFYAGQNGDQAVWSKHASDLVPVIEDANGVGARVSAAYDPGRKLHFVLTEHGTAYTSQLTMVASANPWGPWNTVVYRTFSDPQKRVPNTLFFYNFLANSFSPDGTGFTLIFTGTARPTRSTSSTARLLPRVLVVVATRRTAVVAATGTATAAVAAATATAVQRRGGNGNGGSGGNGNSGGSGNSNGSGGSGSSGTGCSTGTTGSSSTQSANSGSSGNTGGTSSNAQGNAGNGARTSAPAPGRATTEPRPTPAAPGTAPTSRATRSAPSAAAATPARRADRPPASRARRRPASRARKAPVPAAPRSRWTRGRSAATPTPSLTPAARPRRPPAAPAARGC